MADQDFIALLISVGTISRKSVLVAGGPGDEGMGPSNDVGNFAPVMVDDGTGNMVQLTVQCRVAQQSARARFKAKSDGKDAIVSTLTIFTDYRTDVQERDRFTVDGVTYDTEEVNDPGLMHHHLEFVAKRIS
jgi:SPP1 family predicted phage head-tail adaptor